MSAKWSDKQFIELLHEAIYADGVIAVVNELSIVDLWYGDLDSRDWGISASRTDLTIEQLRDPSYNLRLYTVDDDCPITFFSDDIRDYIKEVKKWSKIYQRYHHSGLPSRQCQLLWSGEEPVTEFSDQDDDLFDIHYISNSNYMFEEVTLRPIELDRTFQDIRNKELVEMISG